MVKRRFTDVEAYQHADDSYYYRPVVAGDELFTYVAHVPSGGHMPAHEDEADLFELSLFMLEGELDILAGDETVPVGRGDALHIPRGVPVGVTNNGPTVASFVLNFAPPPPGVDLGTMKQSALDRGRVVIEAEDVESVVGRLSFPGPAP